MPLAGKFVSEARVHVRYAETDAMGIVHHSSYIVWFEEGRSQYARARGSDYATFERSGYYLTVAEVNARYLKPMMYGMEAVIRCWIAAMQSRALTFGYEVVDAATDDICVTGQTRHVCITHAGQVALLPNEWRQWGED